MRFSLPPSFSKTSKITIFGVPKSNFAYDLKSERDLHNVESEFNSFGLVSDMRWRQRCRAICLEKKNFEESRMVHSSSNFWKTRIPDKNSRLDEKLLVQLGCKC